MITAIVVPIICLYFYWVTKKEMREQHQKWTELQHVPEEAVLTGTILEIREGVQKFYYNRYINVTELKIKAEFKTLKVKKITPYTKQFQKSSLQIGDTVRLFGNWNQGYFRFNRAEKI